MLPPKKPHELSGEIRSISSCLFLYKIEYGSVSAMSSALQPRAEKATGTDLYLAKRGKKP
jgi:hypothetical protein